MLGLACGAFGWTPEVFWRTSYIEFIAARRGWVLANTDGAEAKALRWADTVPENKLDEDEVK